MGEETQLSGKRTANASSVEATPGSAGLLTTSRRWFPAAVFFTGIVLTLLAAYYASRTIQLRTRAQFETTALRVRTSIRARMQVYDTLLHGTAGFITVEKQVSRERFRKYVERLDIGENYRGMKGIGFAPKVPASEKDVMVSEMRQQGEVNFRIWPETTNAVFFPVAYQEPQSVRNDGAFGYDMFADPTRREAMEHARESGKSATSGKVTSIPEIGLEKQAGFLIYCPIYDGDVVPEKAADRAARLQGFVYCVFRADDLFASVFEEESPGAGLEIFDGTNTDAGSLLFRSSEENVSRLPLRETFNEVTSLDISGRIWTTRFFAQPEPERAWIVLCLLVGGLLLSAAMFYLTRAEGRARRAAERAAARLKLSELALRESEERLRRYAVELERRVAERTANLAQSIESLEGVLYHVAHDLRAPLRSMASFTNILLEEYGPQFDERGRDYTQRVSSAAQRMDMLVQDLLAYGRLAHTAVPVSKINLEAEVNSALSNFSEEIEARGAKVEVVGPLPPVKANAAILNQILSNLISNGLKFVPPETRPHLRIFGGQTTLHGERAPGKMKEVPPFDTEFVSLEGKFVRLWIADNGIGIAPEYHERIFRMFERLHPVGSYPGTGIGLAIVRKGVERMGGRAGVESVPGSGSRFWVDLPAA
ncbi:MAG TPA: CHASE domain-containing protein [Verrucomicrobiae bacterium]|nr:CHASE domain-containing protein [Verrucomicrobiae bacterium]